MVDLYWFTEVGRDGYADLLCEVEDFEVLLERRNKLARFENGRR